MTRNLIATLGVAVFLLSTGALAETKTFSRPMLGQHRLDWCLEWGQQCGEPAASAWCRMRGFTKAVDWGQAADIGARQRTKVMRGGQICSQKFCDGFSRIGCFRPPRLISAQACLDIGNKTGAGAPTCIGEQGHNFGKAGSTFRKGDRVWILTRLRGLDPGRHTLRTAVNRTVNGRTQGSTAWAQSVTFSNQRDAWWFWFPSKARDGGLWTEHLFVDDDHLGFVEYCVNCALE